MRPSHVRSELFQILLRTAITLYGLNGSVSLQQLQFTPKWLQIMSISIKRKDQTRSI